PRRQGARRAGRSRSPPWTKGRSTGYPGAASLVKSLVPLVPDTPASSARQTLARARDRVAAAVVAGAGGPAACRVMADALAALVRSVLPRLPAGMAAVATGGWGRRETAPWSDVDLLFLCMDAPGDAARALADQVLYPLWDGGVEVGHAVRSVAEATALAAGDLATLCAFLDG